MESERRFRKQFCLAIKELLGQEDYEWLTQRLTKIKETEAEEAEKKQEKELANELKEMSPEDYLFYYLNSPEGEKRLSESIKAGKPEDIKRLENIVAKLRLEKIGLDGTLL